MGAPYRLRSVSKEAKKVASVIGFFNNIDWELLMRAVRRHTDCAWALLYIEIWLTAPVSMPDERVDQPREGAPARGGQFMRLVWRQWLRRTCR